MILVDSNIIVTNMRRPSPAVTSLLQRADMAICGVIWAELLHGARFAADVAAVHATLSSFVQLPIGEPVWVELGTHLAALRAAGITVPFQDALIAATALHHGADVWSADQHYPMMQTVIPALRLFNPPVTP